MKRGGREAASPCGFMFLALINYFCNNLTTESLVCSEPIFGDEDVEEQKPTEENVTPGYPILTVTQYLNVSIVKKQRKNDVLP